MKIYQLVFIGLVASSASVIADQSMYRDNAANMPMSPQMQESMRQQWMHQNQRPSMPMMGNPNNRMMMDPQMRQNMMMRQQGGPNMPSGSMMNGHPMHNMMQTHTEQMHSIEQKLTSIESLLTKLLNSQQEK